jgi:hypothetical protein
MIDPKKERKKKNRCGWVLPSKQSIINVPKFLRYARLIECLNKMPSNRKDSKVISKLIS